MRGKSQSTGIHGPGPLEPVSIFSLESWKSTSIISPRLSLPPKETGLGSRTGLVTRLSPRFVD